LFARLIEIVEEGLDLRDRGFVSFNFQPIFARGEFRFKRRFGVIQISRMPREQLVQVARVRKIERLGSHGR
jgi:hypothetical protein